MLVSIFLFVLIYVTGVSSTNVSTTPRNRTTPKATPVTPCGVDRLPNDSIQEGLAFIESFPWLGLIIYPIDEPRPTTTTVILITREIALSAALDIDFYPKDDFRARSRVVLGNNCTGPYIRIRDYTFHPDFTRSTYSTLAIVQLEIKLGLSVFPICAPPDIFYSGQDIYAMSLMHDCYNSSMVMVYKMEYVDLTHCRDYYRRIELGVGIYGPGCQSPSRFLDYGMYHLWVMRSIAKIGQPTITKIAPNHLILRRTTQNIQRYGLCDPEESKLEIFTDKATFVPPYADYIEYDQIATVHYNVTLLEHVEYHCIVLQVWNELKVPGTPTISIRRWCTDPKPICTKSNMLTIYFYVEIKFRHTCTFKVSAYGAEIKYDSAEIDAK